MSSGQRSSVHPDDIVDEFWRRRVRTTQRQLDVLMQRFDIPVMALASDATGIDFPMCMLRVERSRGTFGFSDDPEVKTVCGFVCWDDEGYAQDIAAWSPIDGWVGTWLGRAVLLGAHEVHAPRGDAPLKVFIDPAPWLRNFREGVVVLARSKARAALDGITVAADSIESGAELKKILTAPKPKIVIGVDDPEQAAA